MNFTVGRCVGALAEEAWHWVMGVASRGGRVNDGEGYWDGIKRQSEALEGIMRK